MIQFFPNYNAGRPETPGDWARAREAEGWHGLALSDHFVTVALGYPHLWVALTEMAYATCSIPITSSFANNLFRSPVEFAQAALTLNRVANDRFEAGLGAGWIEDEIVRTRADHRDGARDPREAAAAASPAENLRRSSDGCRAPQASRNSVPFSALKGRSKFFALIWLMALIRGTRGTGQVVPAIAWFGAPGM